MVSTKLRCVPSLDRISNWKSPIYTHAHPTTVTLREDNGFVSLLFPPQTPESWPARSAKEFHKAKGQQVFPSLAPPQVTNGLTDEVKHLVKEARILINNLTMQGKIQIEIDDTGRLVVRVRTIIDEVI